MTYKVGYRCACGYDTIREIEGDGKNHVLQKKTCPKCLKRKRLRAKANKRGKPKDYYFSDEK